MSEIVLRDVAYCPHLGAPDLDHPPHMCGVPRCHCVFSEDTPEKDRHKPWECQVRTVRATLGCGHPQTDHAPSACPARTPMTGPALRKVRHEPGWRPAPRPERRPERVIRALPPEISWRPLQETDPLPATCGLINMDVVVFYARGFPEGDAVRQAKCRGCGRMIRLKLDGFLYSHSVTFPSCKDQAPDSFGSCPSCGTPGVGIKKNGLLKVHTRRSEECDETRWIEGTDRAVPVETHAIVGTGWYAIYENLEFRYGRILKGARYSKITAFTEAIKNA